MTLDEAERLNQQILDADRTPAELIACYTSELARLYGDAIAQATELTYEHGWFYLQIGRRFDNGSIGVWPPIPHAYRRGAFEVMIATLRDRETPRR
jgi:hypothetical protein